ncbi:MAG: polyamine aminopropyltransferase [Bradyrhizobium sp.]|uniref:polyamine aminopropyltransferase n=1 Tax=Bradyrhizobium sp. TaxID=376 RepID=UPI0029B72F42|nr:polyamine aminopropyltransferase [Bradyrhizobium sp.]MDX3968343.1 polyamine aminopropyltransferase [Bradyrhizobium sp.]
MNSFQEKLYEHHSQVFTVDNVLHQSHTGLQNVLVFENRLFGRVMVLDGIVQLTERDNHIYHEMIAHVPLMAHGQAKRVLIIGGGDGGTLKEVLKHPVEEVILVEIDSEVIELVNRFFPALSGRSFEDRRARIIVGNGLEYVATTDKTFDVIIIDSTDPIGPGEQLFTASFYARCRTLLRRGGTIALQSGAPFYQPQQLDGVCARIASCFNAVRPFLAPVPSYAAGMLALVAAGDNHKALRPTMKILRERHQRLRSDTIYYTPEVHRAAFTLPPRFARPGAGKMGGPVYPEPTCHV